MSEQCLWFDSFCFPAGTCLGFTLPSSPPLSLPKSQAFSSAPGGLAPAPPPTPRQAGSEAAKGRQASKLPGCTWPQPPHSLVSNHTLKSSSPRAQILWTKERKGKTTLKGSGLVLVSYNLENKTLIYHLNMSLDNNKARGYTPH